MILPKQVRSGVMLTRSCIPPNATRKPVMTSSKIKSASYCCVSVRKVSRKPGRGNTNPILAATGSTITAAMSSGYVRNSSAMAALSAAIAELFRTYPDDIAAVIVEPVAANMGLVLPLPGFLETLRTLTQQYDALLIFDEVMTGFRVALGGMQ